MTKKDLAAAKIGLKKIEKTRAQIAKQRDILRDQMDEFIDILSTLDDGDEYLQSGIRELTDGLDKMSELL